MVVRTGRYLTWRRAIVANEIDGSTRSEVRWRDENQSLCLASMLAQGTLVKLFCTHMTPHWTMVSAER